jgi:DNA-directed RNA polymerase subunit RPC12/RpoP
MELVPRNMQIHSWKCLICGNEFFPKLENGDYYFNCPSCGSQNTIPAK